MGTNTMGSMAMYFTTDHDTPLWSQRWTPSSEGAYAGTCVFLVLFAVISRGIATFRRQQEIRWHDAAMARRYVIVADQDGGGEGQLSRQFKEEGETGVLTARGINEDVQIIKTRGRSIEGTPWRSSVDLPRSLIYLVQAGVGYLLMLAVMSYNVGYFLSVLLGLFIGEMAMGRYHAHGTSDH